MVLVVLVPSVHQLLLLALQGQLEQANPVQRTLRTGQNMSHPRIPRISVADTTWHITIGYFFQPRISSLRDYRGWGRRVINEMIYAHCGAR